MFLRFLVIFFFLSSGVFGARLPDLAPRDVTATMRQILEAHVTYKSLSGPLIKRSLEYFLEELDPTKTYLLQSEVNEWLNPSDSSLHLLESALEKSDFSYYQKLHEKMIHAIGRRERIEQEINSLSLPKKVSLQEFKELERAKDESELKTRLLRIRALQIEAAEKLGGDSKEKALQRIQKMRLAREAEIICKAEKEQFLLSAVLKSLASSLDAHTAYFTPAEASQFMIQLQQRLFGIGALLRDDLNGFMILKIIEGGPASRNTGLKLNDRVIAINKEPVVGMNLVDAVALIRGEAGTPVLLTVLREVQESKEEKLDIEILRGEVVIKEARIESSTIPFGDGVIAHIALHAFYQDPLHSSAADIYEEIAKIKKDHKIHGVILDLRNNSGGVLPQAVGVTGLFISKGIVASIKDNKGNIEHLRHVDGKTAWDGPMIILVSKASASASEIVAQTLQDYGRAIIVGDEHTFGKGTFQSFTLDSSQGKVNPKGEFKVTRGKYYTVSGKSPQLDGVRPDIMVQGIFSHLEIGEKHSKHALENDSIAENFQDDLSDIPLLQRDQLSWLYRFNLQPKLTTYTQFIPALKENSASRLSQDKLYQKFLEELKGEETVNENHALEILALGDLQLRESINIMKDLVVLLNNK